MKCVALFAGLVIGQGRLSCKTSDFATNISYDGSAHNDLAKMKTVDAAACCSACAMHPGCDQWRWHNNSVRNPKQQTLCVLRSGNPQSSSFAEGVISGACVPPFPPGPSPGPAPPPPSPPAPPAPPGAKNVLWFIVDDLRPQFNVSYGQKFMRTPHMDKLAQTGLVFDRAYVQFAVCAPSRNSFMTGRRPDRTQAFNFLDDFRENGIGDKWVTLPEHFKNHGYLTVGGGKTFHPGLPANYDEPRSWSEEVPYFPLEEDKCSKLTTLPPYKDAGDICTVSMNESESLFDYKVSGKAIEWMQLAQKLQRPFFIAVGIRRPHLDWAIPKEFFALYAEADVGLPRQPSLPKSIHSIAWSNEAFEKASLNGSTWKNMGPFNQSLPDRVIQELRRGYYGAVSWIDSQMGRVLNELEASGQMNNTIVVVHGDHGYQLGEKACWTKHTNFELGTRVPLIIRAPFKAASVGRHFSAPVEIVDLYQTLAELAGVSKPEASVQGKSLARVFDNPVAPSFADFVAYSQYDRCPKDPTSADPVLKYNGACKKSNRTDLGYMGYTIRTSGWRYTAWMAWDGAKLRGRWEDCSKESGGASFCARELYMHGPTEDMSDFESFELENRAEDSAYAAVVEKLHEQLQSQFEGDQMLFV